MVRLFTSPVDSLLTLQKSLSDTMLSDRSGSGPGSRGGFPPINVFQRDDEYAIVAELPGVSKDNIDIKLENRRLSIQGHIDSDNHENFDAGLYGIQCRQLQPRFHLVERDRHGEYQGQCRRWRVDPGAAENEGNQAQEDPGQLTGRRNQTHSHESGSPVEYCVAQRATLCFTGFPFAREWDGGVSPRSLQTPFP